jgi:hypothetical protein
MEKAAQYRASLFVLFAKYYKVDQINKDLMGGGDEKCIQNSGRIA